MRKWWICGFAFSLCLLAGRVLDADGSVGPSFAWALLGAAALSPLVGWLCGWLSRRLCSVCPQMDRRHRSRFFALCTLAVFAAWLPALLGLYPGVFSYDVLAQVIQGGEILYMQNHPLLHTLLINALLSLGERLGNINLGVAAYSVLQMMLLALSIGYASSALYAAGSPLWLCAAGVLCAMVLPCHGVLAVSTTKDSLFAAGMLTLVVLLFERRYRWSVVLAVLVCLLRNNGWYALAAAAVLGLLLCKGQAARFAAVLTAGAVWFFAVNGMMASALDARGWNTREALSVPIQQMARVITLHPEWQDDADVQALFQGEVKYNPALSDPVKFVFRADGETPISQVIRLWARMLVRYPVEYTDAFAELTQGWWDVLDESHSVIYGEDDGYMHTNVLPGWNVERIPVVPALEEWYQKLLTQNAYRFIPGIRLLFAPAVWVWLLLFVLLAALIHKRYDVIQPMLIPFGLLLTMLLGPCCLVRYAYPIMLCAPVGLGMLCGKKQS